MSRDRTNVKTILERAKGRPTFRTHCHRLRRDLPRIRNSDSTTSAGFLSARRDQSRRGNWLPGRDEDRVGGHPA